MPTISEAFTGFRPEAIQFLADLAANNDRAWFQPRKGHYERLLKEPLEALCVALADRFAATGLPLSADPNRSPFRIYRDVRFSKDKQPYKTHIGGVITVAGKKLGESGNAAMYVHLGIDEEFVGVGTYMFDPERLARWRKAVAGKAGAELASLVAKLRKAGYEVGGHDDYKKVPKGFDPDHPRAEFLKMKGLTAGPGELPKGILHEPDLATWLVKHGKALAPLVTWLDKHVG